MGPQKKVMRNELGEEAGGARQCAAMRGIVCFTEVVTSNEDMIAEAVRDGTLKGLGSGPQVEVALKAALRGSGLV